MARVVKELPKRAKLDLLKYLDGKVWELEYGKDFDGSLEKFFASAYLSARHRGLWLRRRTRTTDDGKTLVYIQATKDRETSLR